MQRSGGTITATGSLRVEGVVAVLFQVLGLVGVTDAAGREVAIGGPQQRRLLALLLAAPGRHATSDSVVEALWPDDGIDGRHSTTLRSYVFRLRACLGDATVLTTEWGYRLVLHGYEVDADLFEALVRSTSETTDPAARVAALDEALGAWRGPPYGEFADEPWCRAEAARLAELNRSHPAVDPSISVNRNVTVPDGWTTRIPLPTSTIQPRSRQTRSSYSSQSEEPAQRELDRWLPGVSPQAYA